MYRVSIRDDKYRAVLVGSNDITWFEESDWRRFASALKIRMEHEATDAEYEGFDGEQEIFGIDERRR